jgi:hypothetical protein
MTNDIVTTLAPTVGTSAPGSNLAASAPDLETALRQQARQFTARSQGKEGRGVPAIRLVIADWEYAYDRSAYAAYQVAEGADGERDIRWPFHRIACATWMVLRLEPGAEVPLVETITTLAADEADEREIAARLFGTLELHGDALLISWGGESKDFAVLRRVASEAGLLLPPQLLDPHPHSRLRLDLCRAVSGSARFPHLPEYASASGVPCKPSPSKEVGTLVANGQWNKVREQCFADVLTTSVIALRHLAAHGVVACHTQRSVATIAEAAGKAMPRSTFVRSSFAHYARAQLAASRLTGTIYRAA